MIASFFGPTDKQLFGRYHPPRARQPRDLGVVLCYPGPQEYNRMHWSFRRLSAMLARGGFHVFAFDWFGTGDSAGESSEGRVAQWRSDLRAAVAELKDVGGVSKVSIVGYRLGAAIAASTEGIAARDLILWDPVIRGSAYVDELFALQDKKFAEALHRPPRGAGRGELLGFPFDHAMERDVRALSLLGGPRTKAERVVMLCTRNQPDEQALKSAFAAAGMPVEYTHVPEDSHTEPEDLGSVYLAGAMLAAITSALAGSALAGKGAQ